MAASQTNGASLGWALILAFCATMAFGAPESTPAPTAGARFLRGPIFAAQNSRDQQWSHRSIASAERALAPILSAADEIIIYSLDPSDVDKIRPGVTDRDFFHGFPILGRAIVRRAAEVDRWRRTFIEGFAPCERVLCFAPRHGVRIHARQVTVDLVLCFECQKMQVIGLDGTPPLNDTFFDAAVRQALNAFLDAQGIKRDLPQPDAAGAADSQRQ